MQMTVVDEAGAQHTVYMRRHYNAQQPHISEDFVKLEQAYLDCGAAGIQNLAMQSVSCATRGAFPGHPAMFLLRTPKLLSPSRSSRRGAGRG